LKTVIVHDWLVTYAGAESVLTQILDCFPEADLFAIIDFLPKNKRHLIHNKKVTTSFIQKIPFAKKKYRALLPLMPLAIEQFDLSRYDLVISSSHAVAKGVITGPDQLHISYVYTPIRYAWDLQHQYLRESKLVKGPKSILVKWLLHKMRNWDIRTSNGVDHFLCISDYINRRINKVYRRKSEVIYPCIDLNNYICTDKKEDFYFTASRMVPYKKIDLIVSAFAKMPDQKLIVIGEGPDWKKIKKLATHNITLLGYQTNQILRDYMQRAKAFVFAAEEDFGILPVEAQACGTPVIAYGKGGCLETVIPLRGSIKLTFDSNTNFKKPTGVFFKEQSINSLVDVISYFEKNYTKFSAEACRNNAERFSKDIFEKKFKDFVFSKWIEFSREQVKL
jgi:glycosyltransferase involved in cell wall biosynthesis